jgi:hypothetical protein
LAFHPYPRVIPPVFNPGGFGPPRGLTPASACPRIAHPASRPPPATERPVQTRFRSGSLGGLASPRTVTRWLILQKARRHSLLRTAPAARGRAVSGAVSLPSRGAFHLSLAVLVRYRSQESVQPWRVVPPASGRIPRGRPYSGRRSRSPDRFAYGALTRFGRPSQAVRLRSGFVTPPRAWSPGTPPPATPQVQRLQPVTEPAVWASPAFARRYSRDLG